MTSSYDHRVLALAGMAQALQQVRRIAETGQSNLAASKTVLDSVFRIDADSVTAVYGSAQELVPGLRLLRDYFQGHLEDPTLSRLGFAVIQLERRFVADQQMLTTVGNSIVALAPLAHNQGSMHPDVLASLGKLYSDTLSHLRPRIMVQGNPHYLGQANVVSEVRAMLLTAVRSAVLWRQLGGSPWQFLLAKRAMASSVEYYLG
ncbi:MAG: high frequency lysogenization protein HflD [Xanthomonadaceae bacterium]|jgi:high frequency lysogenization protein|nr:high frequency lysogenization protein HflD [Xanthomonadaceae bacterium]